MKKHALPILAGLMAVLAVVAVLFLCTHGSMLPEKKTEYYEQKAKMEAETATGAEAELMALLLGSAPAAPAETEAAPASFAFRTSAFSRFLAAALGLLLPLFLVYCIRHQKESKGLLWFLILAVPLGLFFARLVYCLTDIAFYLRDIQSPLAMLNVWEGGLSMMGALAGITLAGVLGAKIAREKPLDVLNRGALLWLAFPMAVAAANSHARAGWGPELALPLLSVPVNDQGRLDTALLTAIMLGILLFVLANRHSKGKLPKNRLFLYAAFLFGCLMVPLESLRRDGHMVWGFVHAEMLYAMLIFFPAAMALASKKRRIPLLAATVLLAGCIIGLEFMLDRSGISDLLLYIVYILCVAAYIFVGLKWANTTCGQAKNNV